MCGETRLMWESITICTQSAVSKAAAHPAAAAAAAGSNALLPGTTFNFSCMLYQDMIKELTAPNGGCLRCRAL